MTPRTEPDRLTLEQKASLLSGRDFWSTTAIEEHDIPSLVLTDGPHGIRKQAGASDHLGINDSEPATCFPLAVAVGSSWDPEVAARLGAAVGREAIAEGVAVVLGPGVNIKRSPLCGRNFEYYSEDPLLSGVLGAAHVRALQAEGPGASVKHFAVNNQETERMRISAEVDERTLREIYLAAFERIVCQARPATVMSSYNKINGVSASENHWLLTEVLRQEWGYEGAVVSDWGAVGDRVAALAAGLDLVMPGAGHTDGQLVDAVHDGRLSEDRVDTAVRRVLALREHHHPVRSYDVAEHHALARELASDCAVLLKNDDAVLPLDAASELAVIGEFAVRPRFQGAGSSHLNPTRIDVPLDAIRELARAAGREVGYAAGFAIDEDAATDPAALRAEAVALASAAQTAIVFAGLGDREESEGFDREVIELPAAQRDLIRAVAEVAPRTVVVLSNGGVVSLEGWHDEVDAILEGWLLGQAAGSALADVLFGVVGPSGRLAETIPLRLEDNPAYLNFPGEAGRVSYGEGVMVGYRYYETVGRAVRYPFGHGLGYTTFATDALSLESTGPDTAVASVTVTNTGDRAGKHVVQVYVATEAGAVRRPTRELRAFTKIALEPGETRTVELPLDRRSFAFYDTETACWRIAPGEYRVQVCRDASEVLRESVLTLDGDPVDSRLSRDSAVGDWFAHPVVGPMLRSALAGDLPEEQGQSVLGSADVLAMISSMPMRQFLVFTGAAVSDEALAEMIRRSEATA
ncbi:glycoside hydrolase family 3 protein [Actinoalloteichus hymeniacidonis]|uniref:Exo-alpha-(1->6)-L-arabinopyranosidase n=1 Tax=Actinoalloteichus hymeniacidonis TaxID=340345 RepID=A0AAC9HRU8_9PSEU|nr:glycoside hydrolase family 3 C-terminal domain-containing protein [Actinoalloteichus hymeniacidonis]AOS64482.1 beta-glucosidase-like glycosyl hydrolase [Actinoalloteichus hymeniacidonis]MBB5907448.1 beta-glucosidase [Actinoalloteichus hymeniacidonis]